MPPPEDPESLQTQRLAKRKAHIALQRTRALLLKADEAYTGYGCPASGECCQLATTQLEPWLWPPEWALVEEHLRANSRALPPPRADGGCPFLDDAGKRCTLYESRPFGCRTFFCSRMTGPSRHPAEKVDALSRRLEEVAQAQDPDCKGPRPLGEWIALARRRSLR